jgi:NAD(P)H-flavin reductase
VRAETRVAEAPAHSPMLPRMCSVVRRRRETHDSVTIELDDNGRRFQAGQFSMLAVPGIGESAISISGDPAGGALVHTIRAVGPVTAALTHLRAGDSVGVRGPFGTGWPLDEAEGRDVVILAGGIGLAPLRPALLHLLAHRDRYRRVSLLYGARNPSELLFRNELERWRRRLDVDVAVTVDGAPGDWRGQVGVVTRLIPRAAFEPGRTLAMLCGPEVMMRFATAALGDAGVGVHDVFVSLERRMTCGVGLCGHCQLGPVLICRDGPVVRLDAVVGLLGVREL